MSKNQEQRQMFHQWKKVHTAKAGRPLKHNSTLAIENLSQETVGMRPEQQDQPQPSFPCWCGCPCRPPPWLGDAKGLSGPGPGGQRPLDLLIVWQGQEGRWMRGHQRHSLVNRSTRHNWGFPGGSVVRSLPANAGDMGSTLIQEDPTCCGAAKSVCHSY